MAEGEVHKELKKRALFFLKEKVVDLIADEVKFKNIHCIADAVGINLKRKEIRIVEAKATREDFFRDKKLFQEKTSYVNHAHFAYIICPKDLISPKELPKGYGLLYVDDNNGVVVIKNPVKNTNGLKTRFDTTLKRTARRLSNTLLYENKKAQ